jgi:hypothetical protein
MYINNKFNMKEEERVRDDINSEKNRITSDVLLDKLNKHLDKKINFDYDKKKEYIPSIAILNNNINLHYKSSYENTYNMIEILMTKLKNSEVEEIDDVGYVFYLDESEYNKLQKDTNYSNIFKHNIIKRDLVDEDTYNIDGKDFQGAELSIDNITYSFINDIITGDNRKIKIIEDLLKDKDIGTTNK